MNQSGRSPQRNKTKRRNDDDASLKAATNRADAAERQVEKLKGELDRLRTESETGGSPLRDQSLREFDQGIGDKFDDEGGNGKDRANAKSRDTNKIEPETWMAESVTLKGELEFDKLVRVDGTFEGNLKSEGDLEIGPTGMIRGPLIALHEVICEGKIYGNVQCERLVITAGAAVFGNLAVKRLIVEEGGVHVGKICCHSAAPKILQEDGTLIDPAPAPAPASQPKEPAGNEGTSAASAPSDAKSSAEKNSNPTEKDEEKEG